MAMEQVSMDLSTLSKLAKNSKFNPEPPSSYKSAETLWSDLLEQMQNYDREHMKKQSILNKATKRLHMLAKLIYVYNETLWRPEHGVLVSSNKCPESHCKCCVYNAKQVCALQTQLAENVNLESKLIEIGKHNADIEAQLTQSYTEVKRFKDQAASTDVVIAKLNDELAARSQLISNLQDIISNFSKIVPALSYTLKSRLESSEVLPSAGQKGGSRAGNRLNIPNSDPSQKGKGKTLLSAIVRTCKSRIVRSASLAMEKFRRCRDNLNCPKPSMKCITCFSCGGLGHIAKDCKLATSERQKKHCFVKCFKCGSFGHIARHCPSASSCKVSRNVTIENSSVWHRENGYKKVSSQPHVPHHVLMIQSDQLKLGRIITSRP
ncbi:uncharacterized protein [Engystomops pustulosus]|uniref:uncharacterized protein n=1 Tax=Engystomops pustulosus TaxID=76066 RepID=UPI003AFB2825